METSTLSTKKINPAFEAAKKKAAKHRSFMRFSVSNTNEIPYENIEKAVNPAFILAKIKAAKRSSMRSSVIRAIERQKI